MTGKQCLCVLSYWKGGLVSAVQSSAYQWRSICMRPMVALEVEMIVHDTNGGALGPSERIESHEKPYSES